MWTSPRSRIDARDGGKVPIGQWVRVSVIHDDKSARLYQNGEKAAQVDVPSAPPNPRQELLIGQYTARNEAPDQFKGKLRGLALYARALKPDEIGAPKDGVPPR